MQRHRFRIDQTMRNYLSTNNLAFGKSQSLDNRNTQSTYGNKTVSLSSFTSLYSMQKNIFELSKLNYTKASDKKITAEVAANLTSIYD